MDPKTFDSIPVSDEQLERIQRVRVAAKAFCDILEKELPDGPDKTFTLRNHRTTAMWANAAIVRHPDGSPRT